MKLIVLYPGVARISCADCQKWVYDFSTGEPETYMGQNGTKVPCPRPSQIKPPCDKCPKRGPEHEQEHTLTDQNLLTYMLYNQVRATSGMCLTEHEREDGILAENMSRVTQIMRVAAEQRGAMGVIKNMMGPSDV